MVGKIILRSAETVLGRLTPTPKSRRDPSWLRGDFKTWHDALAASGSYQACEILDAVKQSVGRVKRGDAVYERDSVVFDEVQYSWPLLTALMWEAAQDGGRLEVLDFGGSLGSTYFQNRRFLSELSYVRWNIVEQPHFVREGRTSFESEQLRFYETIESCLAETSPTIVILSGVLPYLEKPYELLSDCISRSFRTVVIDRTFVWQGDRDRLCVQDVPPCIFPASYPIWVFSEECLRAMLAGHDIVAEFPGFAEETGYVDCQPKGFVIRTAGGSGRARV